MYNIYSIHSKIENLSRMSLWRHFPHVTCTKTWLIISWILWLNLQFTFRRLRGVKEKRRSFIISLKIIRKARNSPWIAHWFTVIIVNITSLYARNCFASSSKNCPVNLSIISIFLSCHYTWSSNMPKPSQFCFLYPLAHLTNFSLCIHSFFFPDV
jgi:hypothetical protein